MASEALVPLAPLPPPSEEPRTPVKGKQKSLFEAFGLSAEKTKKPSDDVQSQSHKKLRKILCSDSLANLEAELKGLRDLEAIVELQRATKDQLRKTSTELVDPLLQGRG
jgi:serine/threonine protein phosphatase PrpC